MVFRSVAKYILFVAILSLTLCSSWSAYSQTVEAADLGASSIDIYKINKQQVYGFSIYATGGDATITGLTTQPTGGNYTSADILSFGLYFNNVDDFNSATLVGTSSAPAGFGETINFGSFSQTITGDGLNRYFYIAANVAPFATSGSTFNIPFLTNSNFTFTTAVSFTHSLGPSGTKTIQNQLPFITTWKTDNPGGSNDDQITIPTTGTGYDYNVDWGDATSDANVTGSITHTYATPGTYTVSITGAFPRIYFNATSIFTPKESRKILTVEQWGNVAWTSMASAFSGCANLRINAADKPDLSRVTDMSRMFYRATALNDNINSWDVSNVTNMSQLFAEAEAFNQPLDNWNVSSVTNMSQMFWFAYAFNQNIGGWTVSNVTNMGAMFTSATSFNQNIGGWNVIKVTSLSSTFSFASVFNQDISGWAVDNVTDMSGLFNNAIAFNQDISGWNINNVTSMANMFKGAIAFTNDITGWNVTNVKSMSGMLSDLPTFNQDISSWTVTNVLDMSSMFENTPLFNRDISGWSVGNVTNMNSMFANAIGFNQDIGGWNVGNVTDMRVMFSNATSFDQDLGGWDVRKLSQAFNMLNNSGMGVSNYDNLLTGWASQSLKSNVNFGAQGIYYCNAGPSRSGMEFTYNWTITDAGPGCIAVYDGTNTAAPEIANTTIDIGSGAFGIGKSHTFTIVNRLSMNINGVSISVGGAFNVPPFVTAIVANGSIVFDIDLSGATVGSFSEPVIITSGDISGNYKFTISGEITTTPEPEIAIFEGIDLLGNPILTGISSYYLGGEIRGNDVTNQFTITNKGSAPLVVSTMSVTGTQFSFGSAAPFTIPVDNTVTVDVILSGTVARNFSEVITITSNDTDEANFDFGISGDIYGPEIAVFDGLDRYSDPEILNGQVAPIAFGSVAQGTDITRTLTIANFGPLNMTLSDISITGTAFSTTFSAPDFIAAENDGIISTLTFDLTLSGATGGTFNETVTITSDDDTDPLFQFPLTGTITGGTCANPSTVNAGADTSTCPGTPFTLSGTIGGGATTASWSSNGTGTFNDNTQLNATYTASPADETSGSVTLTLTVAAIGLCPQVQDQLILTIPGAITAGAPSVTGNVGQTTNVDVVSSSATSQASVSSVTITQNPTQGVASVNADLSISYTPNAGTVGADSFEYEICNNCGLCDRALVAVGIVNAPPLITPPSSPIAAIAGQSVTIAFSNFLSDLNANIDFNSIKITAGLTSNALATFDNNYDLTIDYSNTPFAGRDQLTIEVCDLLSACANVILQIEVDGEIIVYNGVSPNGDGKNDHLEILNIQFLEPENKVNIYNRWGDKVFEMENYHSKVPAKRFEGNQNNGTALPSGIYFYKVEFSSGRVGLTGYFTLKNGI